MELVQIVAVVMGTLMIMLSIICKTIVKLRKGRPGNDPDTTKLIQEVHHGLLRMEQRIEALETILFDRERKDI